MTLLVAYLVSQRAICLSQSAVLKRATINQVAEFPAQYALQRMHLGRSLASFIIAWGVIVMCIAFAKNWAGLMVLRALQGVFECTISPAFLLLTGSWYKKNEQAARTLIWGTANAGMFIGRRRD
jgi:ACS family allantoate permease-like MFS transporter